jgi:hypothetical protein
MALSGATDTPNTLLTGTAQEGAGWRSRTLTSPSGSAVTHTAEITKRLKAADPTIVDGPSSPGADPSVCTVSSTASMISGCSRRCPTATANSTTTTNNNQTTEKYATRTRRSTPQTHRCQHVALHLSTLTFKELNCLPRGCVPPMIPAPSGISSRRWGSRLWCG